MNGPILKSLIVTLASAGFLLADFSYEQTSRITGGAMASMMKLAGAFSKQAREPIKSSVAVKGDRMVHLSPQSASIIDLGKETITDINFEKKTYSVMTFAEMKQMLDELTRKTQKDADTPDMQFKVSVEQTGQTKDIAGMSTRQTILKMVMETTDKKSGQKSTFVVTSDMWLAPKVAGYDEVAAFHKRMAEKLAWTPGSGMLQMGGSQIGKSMAELAKEASKLDGIPVYQIVRMGAEGLPQQQGGQPQQAEAQQPQQQQQQETQVEKPSIGGALGGALGGRLGGFGRRRKTTPPPEQQPQQQQPQQTQQEAAPAGAPGSLMEMTSEMSAFSSAAVDAGKFEVPAGFKQVKPEKRVR